MIQLQTPQTPSHLKIGFFGETGSGKTFTAAKVLSQFIKRYCPKKQLAFFDTEPAAGYVKDMVKEISGNDLLAIHSRSFSDLLEFAEICSKGGHVALLDSATHPWRALVADYLAAKASRLPQADRNRVSLSLKDWGPIKEMWGQFSERYCYDPIHWCLNGREGDKWDQVENDEGDKEMQKVGVKMKTETETGYEPSLLIQMKLIDNKHYAFVVKDRFNVLTGQMSGPDPDIEFFMPYIEKLDLKAQPASLNKSDPIFVPKNGPSWDQIKDARVAILENIKDDILLAYSGQTAQEKKAKVEALRGAFGTSAWTELESDMKKYPMNVLVKGRTKLAEILTKKGE
ncbi:MAG TPA: hypothetical protein VMW44_00735 [Candidatus Bathyarchaeia archaeon]|nr:hypothetical protein [Candidatus Bathyarchaeia archaeon]